MTALVVFLEACSQHDKRWFFFQDGLKTADRLKQYIEKLAADLYNIKQTQDEEKKQLTALRDLIKSSLQLDPKEVWQRRQCSVKGGILTIAHGTAEDEQEFVIKEEALNMTFRGDQSGGGEGGGLEDLTKAIIDDWLSTNLGILTCIECSGIHREMGVHISRIQSMELDKLGTSELLLAKNIGNSSFNEIMEGSLPSPSPKPTPSSDMTARKEFINSKYVDHRFSRKTCSSAVAKMVDLCEAVQSRDLLALLQVYAEGVELMEPLPEAGPEAGETALHFSVRTADHTSLHLVDFLPSPIKKERSPRPQSFCHASSLSPHDKLSLPGFLSHRDKQQRLSYSAFTNQVYSASTDLGSSPVDGPPLPPRNQGKAPHLAFLGSHSHYATLAGSRPATLSKKRPPPPPPGHKRTLSDPPGSLTHGLLSRGGLSGGSDSTPPPMNKMSPISNKFEGIPQPQSSTSANTKSTLGPRVLPKLPQKVALRKIDSIHHPSMDKPSLPPEVFQKSPPGAETPQKTAAPERPHPGELPPKPQASDLPPKPGELPPKPQLLEHGSHPGNPLRSPNLKLHLNQYLNIILHLNLHHNLQLNIILHLNLHHNLHLNIILHLNLRLNIILHLNLHLNHHLNLHLNLHLNFHLNLSLHLNPHINPKLSLKSRPKSNVRLNLHHNLHRYLHRKLPLNPNSNPKTLCHPNSRRKRPSSQQSVEVTNGSPAGSAETPVPLPRKINTGKSKGRRVKTIYDCQADNDDELTFVEGEVIIVTGEEDQEWWIGHIEGYPERKGVFPMSFVHILSD
ncbi:LOW QUALITY PROTEIN: hypothetical protein CRUP_029822 [Coryphaenoides rupestris]|nr:LOW QUALITY PROTEIN: hypothetical protein CRUP_029822 [Coryphaenoides rupestris]